MSNCNSLWVVKGMEGLTSGGPSNKLVFPFMAFLAGLLGGLFGIGGGMLISPLLLHVGIAPEVNSGFQSSNARLFQCLVFDLSYHFSYDR